MMLHATDDNNDTGGNNGATVTDDKIITVFDAASQNYSLLFL